MACGSCSDACMNNIIPLVMAIGIITGLLIGYIKWRKGNE